MSRFKVALVALNNQAVPAWVSEPLEQAGIEFVAHECTSRAELARYAGDADVIWVLGSHQCLYAENLDAIPRCGAIVRSGSGTDNIPVADATRLGIIVANTPAATSDSVSDHALGLLLAVTRQIARQDQLVRQGEWAPKRAWPGWHVRGQSLGLVGCGNIPRLLVKKLSGFDLTVRAYDPFVSAEEMGRHGMVAATLDEVMAQSDFVSVHCPLTKDTHHLVGEKELRRMKRTAILINTSRGPVIDEPALVRALTEGWIAAAGLDVLEKEPPDPHNPLLAMDNVVLTPHIGGYSDESGDLFWRLSLETAMDLAAGRWPRSVVNRDVKPRWSLT
jgi:D-3-phosphoglycerate dehydrogenase